MTGYSKEEVLSMRADQLHSNDAVVETMEVFKKHVAGENLIVDSVILTKAGRKVFVSINTALVELQDKVYVMGVFRDITERKNMQESVRQSEEKLRSIIDNIAIGVALISQDMEILSLNSQMKKWNPHIDLKDGNICYRVFNKPPREEVCSCCPTVKTLKDGLVHEDVTETPMGGQVSNYRIVSSPIKDEDGKVIAAIEMVEDITARKKMEDEAQKRLQELEVFYKASVGREERILELKQEIGMLKKGLGA
jgi:two-component system, cell cycle sensor histidine kinase and response regulator CckA